MTLPTAGVLARRVTATVATTALLILAGAPLAKADDAGSGQLGQTPPSLTWITLKDSNGTSIWNHELSLERGGVLSPDKFFWASVTDSCWGIYRSWCALALWFLDWVLSFSWLQTVAAPLLALGEAMQQVVAQLGLVVTFLTINALLAGLWMLRGRYATAIWEVGIAAVIAALAAGIFAHPVALVAGPNGYIVKASQLGQELAAGLATGQAAGLTPEQQRAAQTGQLVDTFVRQPTQMINFGQVLDGTTCESTYDEVIAAGPYGTGSDIRDQVGDCDPALGEYAANPSSSMAIGSLVFMPAAFVILALALVLAGSVIAAAMWAIFQSLKAVITLVTGLLPGGGRGSLMLTIAETVVALIVIVFASVFLSVFLLIIQAMFTGASGDSVPKTFVLVDVLIVAALVVYVRQHRQLKATSQRLAAWLSHRPGGAPATRMPDRPLGLGGMSPSISALSTAAVVHQLRSTRRLATSPPAAPAAASTHPGPRQAPFVRTPGGRGQADDPGPQVVHGEVIREPPPGGPRPGPNPSPGSARPLDRSRGTVRRAAGALARAGTHAALAYATGGTSTAATAAAKTARAIQTTQRAAVTAKLTAAAITAAPSRTPAGDVRGPAAQTATPPRRAAIALPAGPNRPPAHRDEHGPVPTSAPARAAAADLAATPPDPPPASSDLEERIRARLAARTSSDRPPAGR